MQSSISNNQKLDRFSQDFKQKERQPIAEQSFTTSFSPVALTGLWRGFDFFILKCSPSKFDYARSSSQ
jgi:hypothetical protein